MKIVITSVGSQLSSKVDERFGRAAFFIVVDTEKEGFEAILNESANAPSGAGVSAAKKVAELNPDIVITGNCGPQAHQVLTAANIKIQTGAVGTIEEILTTARQNAV